MSAADELGDLAKQAIAILAQYILTLNDVDAANRKGLSVRIVREPECAERTWICIVDISNANAEKSVEFSICQTGYGGFSIGEGEGRSGE